MADVDSKQKEADEIPEGDQESAHEKEAQDAETREIGGKPMTVLRNAYRGRH